CARDWVGAWFAYW
nr:immunoglobulin heavy chain junction region [Mus musculus]